MVDAVAMTVLGLKSAVHAVVKKVVTTACSTPKLVLKMLLGIQMKIICHVFNCLIQMYRVVQNTAIFKYVFPENTCSEPVVDQTAVVKGAKKMRRALVMTYEQFYGQDIWADYDQIHEEMQKIFRAIDADIDDNKSIFEGLERIKEINRPFADGSWREKYIKELDVIEYTDDESEAEEDKPVNMLDKPECDKPQDNSISGEFEVSASKEIVDKKLEVKKSKPVINTRQQNGILRHRLSVTNAKLEEVLKMSSHLVGELAKLNNNVSQLAVVSEKMAAMQCELGEGRKLLREIEEDRNEMKKKLSTLESMIQEEERFLDDVSCESGYEDCEIHNHRET